MDVGYDGRLICLHETLSDARTWKAKRTEETILRVRFPPGVRVQENAEQYFCYPDEIPAEWLEVVGEGGVDWPGYAPL